MSLSLAEKSLSQVLFDLLIKSANLPQLQPGAPADQSQPAALLLSPGFDLQVWQHS